MTVVDTGLRKFTDGAQHVHLEDTAAVGITDHYGTQQYLAPNGEIVALPLYKLSGDVFNYAVLDTATWLPTLVGSGTAVVTSGELVVSTGVTANSSALVESVAIARFIGLSPNKLRMQFQLSDAGITNNVREWGVDSLARDNGAYFRLSGTTFGLVTKKASVDTVVVSGTFNGQHGTSFAPGTDSHFYEIIYQPRQVVFLIDNKILHTINAAVATWSETLHMHIHYGNVNSGGSTTNVSMKSRMASIARFGISEAQPRASHQTGITAGTVIKYGPGDFHGLILSAIANNSAITVYDNTAASGRVLFASGTMPPNTTPIQLDFGGINFNIGLTLVIAAASSNAVVLYD